MARNVIEKQDEKQKQNIKNKQSTNHLIAESLNEHRFYITQCPK